MGQARIKKAAIAAASAANPPRPSDEKLEKIAQAIRSVVGAITSAHGADCLIYSALGARILETLGFHATMVAGSAAWRVGGGDGDVISHAIEINAPGTSVYAHVNENPQAMAGLFHAWIEVGEDLVDFTTFSLEDKARQLDAMDGGKTTVTWCPKFLWTSRASSSKLTHVRQSYDDGVFGYQRHEVIEQLLKPHIERLQIEDLVGPAMLALASLGAGQVLRIVGLGAEDEQTIDTVRSSIPEMRKITL